MKNVSVEKKRTFMRWVLGNLERKEPKCFSLIYMFQNYSDFTERVHFVEDASKYKNGVQISAACSSRAPFVFYGPDGMSNNIDKATDYLSKTDVEVYIQLNFAGKYSNQMYLEILEDDEPPSDTDLFDKDQQYIGNMIAELQALSKQQLINHALDTRNEQLFRKLITN